MERYDIIKSLIKANDYKSYLEIGVRGRETLGQIHLPVAHGVDPNGAGTHTMTSDEFFESHCDRKYDIIFIDGLHLHEQVARDIRNSLTFLSQGGIIVMHDCLPEQEWHQWREGVPGKPWNGDTWKAFADLRCTAGALSMHTVDTDWGIGLIEVYGQDLWEDKPDEWTWDYFVRHRDELMNVITVDLFLEHYTNE